MWKYEKRLQYPISIKKKDIAFAKVLVTQYGGTFCQRDINYFFETNNIKMYTKLTI